MSVNMTWSVNEYQRLADVKRRCKVRDVAYDNIAEILGIPKSDRDTLRIIWKNIK